MNQRDAQGDFVSVDECTEFAQAMNHKYAGLRAQRQFAVELSKDSFGIYAKVILRDARGSFVYPVEGRLSHQDHDLSLRAGALMLLDYIDEYFDEYLRSGGEVYLPIDWAEYESDGIPMQLKGQILNLEIEQLADDWLAGRHLLKN